MLADPMTTVAFVHGAYHRGTHFDAVASALSARGHQVVAPDLPATDPAAGAWQYAQTVVAALGDAGDVVVVGHSMGGLTAPVVAAIRPVRRIVYVAALIPEPGRSFDDVSWHDREVAAPYVAQTVPLASEDGSASVPAARASEVFFHDAHWEDQRRAFALLRPQQWRVLQEPCPLQDMPDVPASIVVCREDRVVNPAWTARVGRERFGADPIEIDGGHCPMVSRPDVLAGVLADLI